MAMGLRQRFSCVSRRCSAVKEMVFSLQRECYSKHNLCLAVQDHLDTMGNLVQFQLMPFVELMNFLLKCGDEIRTWVGRRLQGQCEQHWGALCSTFTNNCPLSQLDVLGHPTSPPPSIPGPVTPVDPLQQPTREVKLEDMTPARLTDNATKFDLSLS
ncbi:hypothetical protein GOODEAATRI_015588 [Goodea atripinnis]|uniref:Stanniocalcin n=1 Tax=Goodea atripinnis TaxID=208336 RepID=A0ABV0MI29_9TELE